MRRPRNMSTVQVTRRLRQDETAAERVLRECLRNRSHMGAKFRRQHPIGRYIADFYCYEAGLVIELDGGVHDGDYQVQYDKLRDQEIASRGLTVLWFNNQDVTDNLSDVLSKIRTYLVR